MKPLITIVFKYAGILLLSFVALWYILFSSPLNIPKFIPHTPINIHGFLLITFTITILVLAQKEILRAYPQLNIAKLTSSGAAICFLSELFFHLFLGFIATSDRFYHFISEVTSMTIFCGIISFFVAFQLKTKRTKRFILFVSLFFLAFYIVMNTTNLLSQN
jgi:hypothetical protein